MADLTSVLLSVGDALISNKKKKKKSSSSKFLSSSSLGSGSSSSSSSKKSSSTKATSPHGVYLYCKVNTVEVKAWEILSFRVDYDYYNLAPQLRIVFGTSRDDLIKLLKSEGAIIKLEYGQADKKGVTQFKKVTRWKILSRKKSPETTVQRIQVTATIDASYLFEKSAIVATNSTDSTPFEAIQKLPCFGTGEEESNTIKLQIDDNLESRVGAKQKWVLHEKSCLKSLQYVMTHSRIDNPVQGDMENILLPIINFDTSGNPTYFVRDLKLRTYSFDPTEIPVGTSKKQAYFSFGSKKGDKNTLIYSGKPVIEERGTSYISTFWKKRMACYDQAHKVTSHLECVEPMLFKDSVSLANQASLLSQLAVVFESETRANVYHHSNNIHDQSFALQKFQSATTLGFLRKINVKVTVTGYMLDLMPSDITKIDIRDRKTNRKDSRYSTKYMVTKVVHSYKDGVITTHFINSRDSIASS